MMKGSNRTLTGWLGMPTALGLSLALPGVAWAQAESSDATQGGIEDIIVTARKSAESQQRVPIAITTVTEQALTNLSVRDILEIQKVTPGLYMTSSQTAGRAKITIRGQREADSRLTTDPSVGVYIDGVNYARVYGLRASLVDIERIEVLKGPQGTLFGKNTTGGAINITTKRPSYEVGGYIDALYGSDNKPQATAAPHPPVVAPQPARRLVGPRIHRHGRVRHAAGARARDLPHRHPRGRRDLGPRHHPHGEAVGRRHRPGHPRTQPPQPRPHPDPGRRSTNRL